MPTAESLARFAAVLADRSRAGMCLALLDRRAWTAGELARHVGVAPSTASEHLGVLVSAGLLTEQRQGRHRYVRLADAEAAQLIEDLAAAVGVPDRPSSLRSVRAAGRLAVARTCYDHLGGSLGATLRHELERRAWITTSARHRAVTLTPQGHQALAERLGVELPPLHEQAPAATAASGFAS